MNPNITNNDIIPPTPPKTVSGLMKEMFGVFDSCPALYQGMIRYWLMWRLPQIINAIKSSVGLKFHLCSTYQGLINNFLRLFILPDLLVIGQSGHVLKYELLQYEHSFDRRWPNVDGTQPSLGAIGAKFDRPLVDGVIQFLDEWIKPLYISGNILYAPFTTMLTRDTLDTISTEIITDILNSSISDAKLSGLPAFTLKDKMDKASEIFKNNPNQEAIPLDSERISSKQENILKGFNLSQMELAYGRYFYPDTPISQIDNNWGPKEILAFEFCISTLLDCMFCVAGEWCDFVPQPSFDLNLRIPYIEGISAPILTKIFSEDPETFNNFRNTISLALTEAMNAKGSENFSRELARIQKEIINDGISKLDRKWASFKKLRLARLGKYVTGSIGISIGLYFTFSPATLAGLFATSVGSFFTEIEKRISEQRDMKENPMYFINLVPSL